MFRLIAASSLLLLVGGCSTIAYYAQAVEGHMRLMAMTRTIQEMVIDAGTDPTLRQQLEQASAIREFASKELALPNNRSYRSFADLGRPYVVWNVFSAPELSVELQQWCMPFIGCVNYRGYYKQSDAELYASELRRTGADIYVAGISAYSTLGYFNDPVLNTFLHSGDQGVARIVFHELAHQLIYAQGDSAFNESFATAVEIEGMRRWLSQMAKPERLREFERQLERKAQFHRLVADTREKLENIYASSLSSDAQRRAKSEMIAEMKQIYADLKASWGGYGGYDAWFSQPLNNATLSSVSLYTKWVPAFQALLKEERGDLPRFYRRVAELAGLSKTERTAALDLLLPKRSAFRD